MKCRHCKLEVNKGDHFCCHCGAQLISTKQQVKVTPPKKRKDHYSERIMVDGVRFTVSAPTEEEYYSKARAYIEHLIDIPGKSPSVTLKDVFEKYIETQKALDRSPSSIRSYEICKRNRFKNYFDLPVSQINFQQMIIDESKIVKPKTVHNAWGYITAALNYFNLQYPSVQLPDIVEEIEKAVIPQDKLTDFLLKSVEFDCEMGAILGLHSLRVSEMCALTVEDIRDGYIFVDKAIVPDEYNQFVLKNSNKTKKSTRKIKIIYPRLYEILPKEGKLITVHQNTLRKRLNKLCDAVGIEHISTHGLRRTFASTMHIHNVPDREIMKIGGWSTPNMMQKAYIKIQDKDLEDAYEKLADCLQITTEPSEA